METLNITEAKAQLSRVVEKVSTTGEEVILTRAGKPVAKVTPYMKQEAGSRLGWYGREIDIPDDFDELPDDIAAAFGMLELEQKKPKKKK